MHGDTSATGICYPAICKSSAIHQMQQLRDCDDLLFGIKQQTMAQPGTGWLKKLKERSFAAVEELLAEKQTKPTSGGVPDC
jgi:hypothetical protein